jgi:hypothetical protein
MRKSRQQRRSRGDPTSGAGEAAGSKAKFAVGGFRRVADGTTPPVAQARWMAPG